ncbi:MAG TPA: PAS domain S-box protein [Anaerolineae bacterium]|nr:PAS domain S-box protein [Anaerolineae bacterium]
MKVKHLLEKMFQRAGPYAGIESIEKRLGDNSFLVVLDGDSFLGILTPSDIIKSPHQLVIDCVHDMPCVDHDQDVELVLMVMKETRDSVLPVFKGDEFIGVVTSATITDYLSEYHNELKQVISGRTAELVKANEQLKREIEDRNRAEDGLLESESRFREMAELLPTVICEMDTSFCITYSNNLGFQTFGYTQEELDAGINGIDLLHPDDREDAIRRIEQIVKGVDIGPMEYRMLRKDGSEIFTLVHAALMHKMGQTTGFRVSISDITEQKRLQRRLHQSQKMEAIATLAGGIAHQFNNALCSITGYTGLLEIKFPGNEMIMDYVRPMKKCADQMAVLTSQLLAYALGGRYNPQTILLSEYIEGTLPLIQHTLGPNIRVETDLPPDILNVEADRTQMQMVLLAIMANANEAIEDQGRIRITTKNMEVGQDSIKDYPGLKPDRYVCLSIEDDGKGMDKETRSRIFEPFFTTHFIGRGLGMASVYGIVTNHGGIVLVDSEPGKGTAVKIYLPALETGEEIEEDAEERIVPVPAINLPGVEGTVLVIEDQEPLVKLLGEILERLGYRVLEASTGGEAVEIAKTFDGNIDIALLDIKLPDMEGGRVYPLIMEARPNLKVIVCSGYGIDGPAQKILDAGAQAFIRKPFLISTLAEKLKEVSGGAPVCLPPLVTNRMPP